jgi:hypothetical protein
MSRSARRLSRRDRAECSCGHRAIFFGTGAHGRPARAVRARRDHPLCLRCWRAARSREKARQMAAARQRRIAFVPGPFALL